MEDEVYLALLEEDWAWKEVHSRFVRCSMESLKANEELRA